MIDDADRRALATVITLIIVAAMCILAAAVVVAVSVRLFLYLSGV